MDAASSFMESISRARRVWERKDTGSFVPTPAAYKGHVFLLHDRGEIECIDPSDGKTLSKGKLPRSSANFYSSPTIADGKVYAAREDGLIFVATAEGPFQVLSQNDMSERMIASPVAINNRLLIRGGTASVLYWRKISFICCTTGSHGAMQLSSQHRAPKYFPLSLRGEGWGEREGRETFIFLGPDSLLSTSR